MRPPPFSEPRSHIAAHIERNIQARNAMRTFSQQTEKRQPLPEFAQTAHHAPGRTYPVMFRPTL